MNDIIKQKLATLPTNPGVYLMKDKDGKIIYVGKAINLKNRVRSYFRAQPKEAVKTKALVRHIGIWNTSSSTTRQKRWCSNAT